ncbi:TonB-dependent receptor [Ekhidna sp.]
MKKINKNKLLTLLFLFSSSVIYGQKDNAKAEVTGSVIDQNLEEVLPYVTVAIKSKDFDRIIGGQISDETGTFRIKNIPMGNYVLEFQFIGYKTLRKEVTISERNEKVEIGDIFMIEEATQLEGVEVVAERSTIQQKIDRKVINIGKDLATTGPSAVDLMVNIPSVDVDQNGTVSLRGNDNVMVLVDGKPTNLSTSQLLQQIPSGSIKQIELITNPSAKYIPEGMSGIINIILHKNTNLGFNGSMTSGLTSGHEQRWNGSVDTNYKTKKANYYLNYGLTDGPSPTWGSITRLGDPSEEVWFTINDRTSHLAKIGVDYELGERTVLSGYTVQNWFDNAAFRSTDIQFPGNEDSEFGQEYASEVDNYTSTFNVDAKHQFSGQSSLEVEVDYSRFEGVEKANFDFYGNEIAVDNAEENISTDRENTTINLDYELSLGETKKLEAGAEVRLQLTDNTYKTTNPNFRNSGYDFDRDIYAIYFSFGNDLGKWSYQLGARLEDFRTLGGFNEIDNLEQRFDDQIFSVYPSIFLSYVPDPEKQRDAFNFSVSRRVDRPNLDQVNPMRAWSSARITNVGNPALIPQFTNSAELNYTRQLKAGSITSGIFYRRIHDEITRFGFNDPDNSDNILFSYNNYRNNSAYGFELSGNYQLASWWSLTSSFDLYAQTQRGVAQGEFREVQNVLYNFRMNHSFKASKRLTFQLIGLYRGANTNLQYETLAFYFVNAGTRYSMFKGKGTLSINFNDIFHTQQFSFEGERPVLQSGVFDWDSQTFFIGYSHRFGSGKRQSLKRKKRDNNEKKSSGGL